MKLTEDTKALHDLLTSPQKPPAKGGPPSILIDILRCKNAKEGDSTIPTPSASIAGDSEATSIPNGSIPESSDNDSEFEPCLEVEDKKLLAKAAGCKAVTTKKRALKAACRLACTIPAQDFVNVSLA